MDDVEKPLCETCSFRVLVWVRGDNFELRNEWRFVCNQRRRGWLKTCPQYEREPGSDDE
jgi:DNA-directed RNA polymerase subunit RPC12/RpoP